MPVLQSFVHQKVLMVFIFVKSAVFYARYFIVLQYHTVFFFFFFGFFVFCTIRKQNIGGTCLLWVLEGVRGVGYVDEVSMKCVCALTQSCSVECSMRRRSASASVKFKTPWYSRNDCNLEITDNRCARILGKSSSLRLGSASWARRKMMSLLTSWRKRIRIFLVVPSGT